MSDVPYCVVHESRDTNLDGMCIVYGTANEAMREFLQPCQFLPRPGFLPGNPGYNFGVNPAEATRGGHD